MKIPVVLSTVHVDIGAGRRSCRSTSTASRTPSTGASGRAELRSVLDEITADLGTAVRVEVREADGTTYADIATPPESPGAARPTGAGRPRRPSVRARGARFQPGEEVALAYVVARQTADARRADDRTPPARTRVRNAGHGLVLLGMTSAGRSRDRAPA